MIKLLAVILMITLLLTLGVAGWRRKRAGEAARVTAAEVLFDEARSTAIGKGTIVCVTIDTDDPDLQKAGIIQNVKPSR
jgi:hypothetical protein